MAKAARKDAQEASEQVRQLQAELLKAKEEYAAKKASFKKEHATKEADFQKQLTAQKTDFQKERADCVKRKCLITCTPSFCCC